MRVNGRRPSRRESDGLELRVLAEEALEGRPDLFLVVDLDQNDSLVVREGLLVGLAERGEGTRLAPDVVRDLAVAHQIGLVRQITYQIDALRIAPVIAVREEEWVDVPLARIIALLDDLQTELVGF